MKTEFQILFEILFSFSKMQKKEVINSIKPAYLEDENQLIKHKQTKKGVGQ